jgi:hypothetical protein
MHQQQQNDRHEMQGAFNLVYLLFYGHASCLTPFLRKDFGKEAMTASGIVAFLLIIAWGSFSNSAGMWLLLQLWLCAMLWQRLKGIQNRKRGLIVHSRYNGYPWLSWKLFPWMKDETTARGADGLICMAVGVALAQVDPAVGWFIGVGGFSLLFVEALLVELRKKRLEAMRDAEIEQRSLVQHYRDGKF